MLVAANLRAAAASVGPLLGQIRDDIGLSSTAAGALTTLPVLCFGAVAPLAPPLARRLGYAAGLAAVLACLTAALLVRLVPGVVPLFAGTLMAGAAIAVGNVLIPVLVKRDFPEQTGLLTGMYTTALIASAALAAAVTVPVSKALGGGWRAGLGVWALPAALGLLAWAPQLRSHRRDVGSDSHAASPRKVIREPLAWQVTLFFGAQACGFYAILSWLPTILQSHGISRGTAGLLLGASMVVGLPVALLLPSRAVRARDQRGFAVAFSAFIALGYIGLIAAPASAPFLWAALIGIGQQASFPLALTIVVLRSGSVAQTASLSTLTQSGGYLLAALGPLVVGAVHDLTGSWTPALALLLGVVGVQVLAGLAAGRNRRLAAEPYSGH